MLIPMLSNVGGHKDILDSLCLQSIYGLGREQRGTPMQSKG